MKKFVWMLVGVGVGFALAHRVSKTEVGARLFADINTRAREFGDAVSDGYHQREAELRSAIGDPES